MMLDLDVPALVARANSDSEFVRAARSWNGLLEFVAGDHAVTLRAVDGRIEVARAPLGPHDIRVSAPTGDWERLLSATPPAGWQEVYSSRAFTVTADLLDFGPYYPALRRLVDLMREQRHGSRATPPRLPAGQGHDDAVGRYVHVAVDGVSYRVYYEQTGEADGIPLLLLHTAGADGRLWRHVLENRAYQRRYRMIAVDLPYHGKSVPPEGKEWWAEDYVLRRDFLVEFFDAFSSTLGLVRPVFMGCSIGGLLAPDLAYRRPAMYRAVIAVNGGLAMPPEAVPTPEKFRSWYHPRVSNEWKSSEMMAFMSPTSPEAYRRETAWVYSQGAPPVFAGDSHYYMLGHDLTAEQARSIDLGRTGVYLLTGEYDPLAGGGTQRLADAVPGCYFRIVEGLGHFGPAENPVAFAAALDPVLDEIASKYPV